MRYIGLDLGTKTLGIAISDKLGIIASYLKTIEFKDEDYLSLIEPLKRPQGETVPNFLVCYVLSVVMFPLIGFISEDSTKLLGSAGVGFINIILISLISGFILISIMIFVVYYISITSYTHDLDPDNIVIPISASFTDAISSLIIISVSLVILGGLI